MAEPAHQLAWNIYAELRKELVESQKIRAQIIGFKITFVSALVATVVANLKDVPASLLVVPAFAAIFFDFLISSYSFAIKRIGYYLRTSIEPILASSFAWPPQQILWEQFMSSTGSRQDFSFWGNIGLTLLACVVGIAGVFVPSAAQLSEPWRNVLWVVLLAFLALDAWSSLLPWRFALHGPKKLDGQS